MTKWVWGLIFTCLTISNAMAEDSAADNYVYFGFEPEIVTNYISNRKKLGFVRVGVELMVKNQEELLIVEEHEPLLRAAIIEILGSQTEGKIKSLTGREQIRQQCLDTINELLYRETMQVALVNLLFTKFLYDS